MVVGEGDPGGGQRRATGTGTERKGVKRSPGGVMRATGTRARVISRVAWRPGGPRGRGQGPVGEVGGGGRGGRGEGRAAEAGRETAPARADVGRPAGTRRFREKASSIVRRQCRLPWWHWQAGREPVRAGPQTVSRFQVGQWGMEVGAGEGVVTSPSCVPVPWLSLCFFVLELHMH